MSTPVKLLAFLAAAVLFFGLALIGGRIVGPVDKTDSTDSHGHGDEADQEVVRVTPKSAADLPGGLAVSQNGYTLDLPQPHRTAGSQQVGFTITGPDGEPVTDFDEVHEKQLHLIAVRRDFTGFQHVHPTMDAAGTWTTQLTLTPGAWRIFADFSTAGSPMTLGTDVEVAGDYQPAHSTGDQRTADVGDYQVTLDGDLTAGSATELTLQVSRNGRPVTDLEPYLGAYGHLVALRSGDLAYLHVHPDGSPDDADTASGPEVTFGTEAPSAGVYHLYFDFQHEGEVRTAAFTLTATGNGEAAAPSHEEDHADH